MYRYDANFYSYLASFAVRSAQRVVPELAKLLEVKSVVDFGCGQGAWLSVWAANGVSVMGVDGPYVGQRDLLIDPAFFYAADLANGLNLGRRFDLAQSLEVAEHLPASKAQQFVSTLTAHASRVLFSAAVPGQGGENHINEQPLEYWRSLFRQQGYVAVDYLRPLLLNDDLVEPSYRYNMILYVQDSELSSLPRSVLSCRVGDDETLEDFRPLAYRLRCRVIDALPRQVVDRLARTKAAFRAIGR